MISRSFGVLMILWLMVWMRCSAKPVTVDTDEVSGDLLLLDEDRRRRPVGPGIKDGNDKGDEEDDHHGRIRAHFCA